MYREPFSTLTGARVLYLVFSDGFTADEYESERNNKNETMNEYCTCKEVYQLDNTIEDFRWRFA